MPRLDRDADATGPLVQAFVGAGFRIDGTVYGGGVKLTPETAMPWAAPTIGAIGYDDLADLVGLVPAPEFVILGTGSTLRRPQPALVARIEASGIGIEVMDSRAAARAWGVLRGEDRWIAAALLPLDEAR